MGSAEPLARLRSVPPSGAGPIGVVRDGGVITGEKSDRVKI